MTSKFYKLFEYFSDLDRPSDIPEHRKTEDYTRNILNLIKQSVGSIDDYISRTQFLYVKPNFKSSAATTYAEGVDTNVIKELLHFAKNNIPQDLEGNLNLCHEYCNNIVKQGEELYGLKKPKVFQALRYALTGNIPGIDIPTIFALLGTRVAERRLETGCAAL